MPISPEPRYSIWIDGIVIGRIFEATASPVGTMSAIAEQNLNQSKAALEGILTIARNNLS
jgi:hypothetical protein